MAVGREGDPEDRERSEFHETEYYSKFSEQDGSIPADPNRPSAPGLPAGSPPSSDIDEKTIQELMDAALRQGAGVRPEEPENLDTTIRADWRAPVLPKKRRETAPRTKDVSPRAGAAKPKRKSRPQAVLARKTKGRRWFSRSRLAAVARGLAVMILIGAAAGGVYYHEFIREESAAVLYDKAAEFHRSSDYRGAVEAYERIREGSDKASASDQARLAFLLGGAYEGWWKKDGDSSHFQSALEQYELAERLDSTPLKVFAAESLLAKADLLESMEAQSAEAEEDLGEQARQSLTRLVEDKAFERSPVVAQGIPHRRLADYLEQEDPRGAIAVLARARDNRGFLEDGVENLRIAEIHRDELKEPAQAIEYFELVKQNELATEDRRATAHAALLELRQGMPSTPDLLPEGLLELEPEGDAP